MTSGLEESDNEAPRKKSMADWGFLKKKQNSIEFMYVSPQATFKAS